MESQVREYVLKNYPNTFKKKEVLRDGKGKLVKTTFHDVEPIINIKGTHIEVSNHKDASPIILSLNLFQ